MFLNHDYNYSNGVDQRGKPVPSSMIQADRIVGERPSGEDRGSLPTHPDRKYGRKVTNGAIFAVLLSL
jgi:hypothetical protein